MTDPDNLMEAAAWAKHCDQNLVASEIPGKEGTSIMKAKRNQTADHQTILKTVKESDEDCQLRISDRMQEASDLEDSWAESSGAGNSQACEELGSRSHLVLNSSKCLDSALFSIDLISAPSPPFFFKLCNKIKGSRF